MNRHIWSAVATTALLSLALTLAASASSITYYYTGSQFTSFSGSAACATSQCNLTGYMTLNSPLGSFTDPAVPTAFSFTDGHATWDNTNSTLTNALFATDGSGNITNWVLSGVMNNSGITWYQSVDWPQSQTGDLIQLGGVGNEQSFLAGSWSNNAPVTTPEPSTWALLATGLLGLAGLAWRRQALN